MNEEPEGSSAAGPDPDRSRAGGYSETVLEHYRRPRNVGDLPEADATALVREETCGDMLRFSVRIRGGEVVEARFKAYGCAAAVAAGSIATTMVVGMPVDEVRTLEAEAIVDRLGGLPERRLHAAVLVREAARRAAAESMA